MDARIAPDSWTQSPARGRRSRAAREHARCARSTAASVPPEASPRNCVQYPCNSRIECRQTKPGNRRNCSSTKDFGRWTRFATRPWATTFTLSRRLPEIDVRRPWFVLEARSRNARPRRSQERFDLSLSDAAQSSTIALEAEESEQLPGGGAVVRQCRVEPGAVWFTGVWSCLPHDLRWSRRFVSLPLLDRWLLTIRDRPISRSSSRSRARRPMVDTRR